MLEDDIVRYHSAQARRLLGLTIQADPTFPGIVSIAILLDRVLPLVVKLAPEIENRSAKLLELCQQIISQDPMLPPELRAPNKNAVKILHTKRPLYAALYDLSQRQNLHPNRLILTAHVIGALTVGAQSVSDAAMQGGCRSLRLIDDAALIRLGNVPLSMEALQNKLRLLLAPNATHQLSDGLRQRYADIERLLAQALQYRSKRPRVGKAGQSDEQPEQVVPAICHPHSDTDPHSDWTASSETLYGSTFVSNAQATSARLEGLAPIENFADITMRVPDGHLALSRGDSIRNAVIRSRNSVKNRRRAAQLLPHRWDLLSEFDLVHLWQWISTNPLSPVAAVLLLVSVSGRDAANVICCRIVPSAHQLPREINPDQLY